MFYKRKKYLQQIENKLTKSKILVLTGARQVGKTTLMKQYAKIIQEKQPTCLLNCEQYFSLPFNSLEQFANFLQTKYGFDVKKEGTIMLDEIQTWSDPDRLIKAYYDEDIYKAKMIVTGSRFRGQMSIGSSMVGRGEKLNIFGYSFQEFLEVKMNYTIHLDQVHRELIKGYLEEYLIWGKYPAVVHAKTHQEKKEELHRIITVWIDKDFRYYTDAKYLGDFKKILKRISLQTGNMIKINSITQEFALGKHIVQKMIQFLIDSFVIYRVPPYYADKAKEYNKASELYFHDIGFLNHLRGTFQNPFQDGKIIETFVLQQLQQEKGLGEIYFYKKKNGSEIDFIYENFEHSIYPIEVKAKNATHIPRVFHGFYEKYQNKINKIIITGKEKLLPLKKGNISVLCIPYWNIGKYIRM